MRLAGLDQALRKSGAAVLDGDRFVHAEAFTARGETQSACFHSFREWWRAFLVGHEIERVALEEPIRSDIGRTEYTFVKGQKVKEWKPMSQMKTLLGLYGVRAHAIEICEALGVPHCEFNNRSWRSVVYGEVSPPKGIKSASDWWKQKALDHCKLLSWSVPSKDAAEAALIAEALRISLSPLGRKLDLFADAAE